MTFRAKPVANRPHRQTRDSQSRRNLYMNIGFGVAVAAAILILVGVAAVTYYQQHLAAAATVGGQAITRDDFAEQAQIEVWRLQQQQARIQAAIAAGRMTSAEGQQAVESLNQQASSQNLAPLVLERLIDAKIVEESTTPEERHAWIITVRPETDEGETEPTEEQKAAAKEIADQALIDVTTGGKKWEDVAKSVSTDASASTGGDLGWIDEDAVEDPKWLEAVFAAEPSTPTAVIEGENGDYLIGRVTEVAPAVADSAWLDKLRDAGMQEDVYREAVSAEVLRQALEDKAIADAMASDKQRHIQEIAIQATVPPPGEDAVKVRHILYSPKDDPDGATTLPPDDPAWTEAQLAAQKAHAELIEDPSKFDERAREESDESSAIGETGTGGKLPYVDASSSFVQGFKDAVLKPGLKDGEILAPFKTEFGWHVVQVMYHQPDSAAMESLRDRIVNGGEDFEQIAKDYSEGPEAGEGGDKGWIAKGLIDERLLRAIFATPVGEVSEIIDIPDAGLFLYKVLEERTQTPDEEQADTIEARAFQNWYGEKKSGVAITRELLDELQAAGG